MSNIQIVHEIIAIHRRKISYFVLLFENQAIQRADNAMASLFQSMCIDFRGFHIVMFQKSLDCPDIRTPLQ